MHLGGIFLGKRNVAGSGVATQTDISFATTVYYDADGQFDGTTFTAQQAGIWVVLAWANISPTNNTRAGWLYVLNGDRGSGANGGNLNTNITAAGTQYNGAPNVFALSAGDTLSVETWADAGTVSLQYGTFFGMQIA